MLRWGRVSTGRTWIAIDNDRSSFCHGLRHEADRPGPGAERRGELPKGVRVVASVCISRANDAAAAWKGSESLLDRVEGVVGRFPASGWQAAEGRVMGVGRGFAAVGRSGRGCVRIPGYKYYRLLAQGVTTERRKRWKAALLSACWLLRAGADALLGRRLAISLVEVRSGQVGLGGKLRQ